MAVYVPPHRATASRIERTRGNKAAVQMVCHYHVSSLLRLHLLLLTTLHSGYAVLSISPTPCRHKADAVGSSSNEQQTELSTSMDRSQILEVVGPSVTAPEKPMAVATRASSSSSSSSWVLFNGTARGPRPLRETYVLPFFSPFPSPLFSCATDTNQSCAGVVLVKPGLVVRAGCVAGCGAYGVQ